MSISMIKSNSVTTYNDMKKIYIAGKISGECETQELMQKCWKKFEDYGLSILRKTNDISYTYDNGFYCTIDKTIGFTHGFIINSEFIQSGNGTWKQYMKNDISNLMKCDEIHMLPDWKKSRGAKIEYWIAKILGIKIFYVQK